MEQAKHALEPGDEIASRTEHLPRMARIDGIARRALDVAYAQESPNQRLDVFLPAEGDGPFPALIYTHGGGFAFGDKRDDHLEPPLQALKQGIAVVAVEYRLSGEALFPAAVLGCAREDLGRLLCECVQRPIAPVISDAPAPAQEVVHLAGDPDFDLLKLIPAPTNTPVDAGPYITLGMCYATHPGTPGSPT